MTINEGHQQRPARAIALGPPYDDGTAPGEPQPDQTTEERLDRLERHLTELEGTVQIMLRLRREARRG